MNYGAREGRDSVKTFRLLSANFYMVLFYHTPTIRQRKDVLIKLFVDISISVLHALGSQLSKEQARV